MNPLAVFHDHGNHILDPILKKGFRHCFCAIPNGEYWIVVDGQAGLPRIEVIAGTGYDLATFYRDEGFSVIEVKTRKPIITPLIFSNCVGMVKVCLGIRSSALTPFQLYKYLRGRDD